MVQVIPIGGAGEIGKNCVAVRQDDEIIVLDAGLAFPDEEHYGIDIVVPDFTYLHENRDKVRAVFLTHAHEDHVGALAHLMPALDCPVYATELTTAMVLSKLEERGQKVAVDMKVVQPGAVVQAGAMSVEFVSVAHSIPETCAMAVRTAHGILLFTTDFRFDFTPVDGKRTDVGRLTELGKEGVLLLVSDSTNADRPGWGPSESTVADGLRQAFLNAPGRVFITTFASNIHRMQQVFDTAQKTGRKVAVAGRRMETTLDLCIKLGKVQVPKGGYIRLDEVGSHRAEELVVLTTGSQGEPMAALSQMARDEYHRMKIVEGDTVLYSARPIPGNESAVWRTINNLTRMGAHVVYDSELPIHVSGHAYQEELKMMIALTRPYYIAPIHGEPRHVKQYINLALGMGHPKHRAFTLENGLPLCMDEKRSWFGDRVPVGTILIDHEGSPGVPDEVMSERQSMGQDGVIVVKVGFDFKKGVVVSKPELIAKGFSGAQDILDDAREALIDEIAKLGTGATELRLQTLVQEVVRRVVNRKCRQRPLVVPALLHARS